MQDAVKPVTQETVRELSDVIFGWWRSRLLYVGTQLGIFDLLPVRGAMKSDDAASVLRTDPPALYRVMRALAAIGTLRECAGHEFALAPMGMLLRKDTAPSLRDMVLLEDSPTHFSLWSHLDAVVRDGLANGVMREHGHDYWTLLERDSAHAAIFNAAMTSYSKVEGEAVIDALASTDLSSVHTMCDVGGGHGRLLSSLLAAWPQTTGVVLELPKVVESVKRNDLDPEVSARLTFVPGNAFVSVPTADAYFIKHMLHDFNDDECVRILAAIRRATVSESRVFICGFIIPNKDEPHFSKLFDIHMLIVTTGRERTVAEYTALLEAAGFGFTAFHPSTRSALGVIEAHTKNVV